MPSIKSRIVLVFLAAGLLLASCSSSPPLKQYPLRGKITALDAGQHVATIDQQDIPGLMPAMTMGYPVKDTAEFSKLKIGDAITATVNMKGDDMWVADIKPDTAAKP